MFKTTSAFAWSRQKSTPLMTRLPLSYPASLQTAHNLTDHLTTKSNPAPDTCIAATSSLPSPSLKTDHF